MEDLINNNYNSIKARGLITSSTTKAQFIDKLFEEVSEVEDAVLNNDLGNLQEELADVILTALNFAKHYDFDIEQELKKKVEINFKRAGK